MARRPRDTRWQLTADTPPFCSVPLNQFHFHSPSEHTINGVHYPLEMHMVHKLFTTDGTVGGTPTASTGGTMAKAAVIGIMFGYECVPAQLRRGGAAAAVARSSKCAGD